MSALIRVNGLNKRFWLDKESYVGAASDVTIEINRGETLGLVGESGSGKTTVGRCLLRLIDVTSGEIWFGDEELGAISTKRLRELRARFQLVFQDPFGSLNPRHSVRRTVAEPLELQQRATGSRASTDQRVRDVMKRVGLSDRYLNLFPGELTASEQQRVGIARAIATEPELVVLDEPTSALDPTSRAEILQLLDSVQAESGTAYLFISHDLLAVAELSHRIAVMYLGRIVETAPTAELFARPVHPYTRALLSAVLYPDPDRALPQFPLSGEIPTAINPPPECPLVGRCPHAKEVCSAGVPPLEPFAPAHEVACVRANEIDRASDGQVAV